MSEDTESEDGPDAEAAPQRMNAATVLGTSTPALDELLNRDFEFLTGHMYGARDNRNTLDGDWTPGKMPLIDLITGFDKTSESPEFGLSRHTASKKKEGPCIVFGSSIDGARQAKAMKTMHFLGIDIDSGAMLEDVKKRLIAKNIFCLVHTSFNHGKSGLTLKRDVVLQKLGIKTDPTLEQVHQYLREFDKNRYEEAFIQDVRIDDPKKQEKSGVVIVLDTPPLDKFRLIFPLAEPVEIIELAETHQGALEVWEDAVTGMAHKVLGVHFDTSCTDPSRLFFTPRHPRGSKNWASYIIRGEPLPFETIPRVKKSTYTKNRDLNPFIEAGGDEAASKVPEVLLPSGATVNEWHTKIGKTRFNIAYALETLCPDRIRVAGGERDGTVHTECPFEHEHTKEGGTGTMARNPDANDRGYWSWSCHHDACQHRHKTELLGEAIAQGWFDESVLTDDEWLLPLSDQELEEAETREKLATTEGAEALAGELNQDSSDDDIREVVARAVAAEAGDTDMDRLKKSIVGATDRGARVVNVLIKSVQKDAANKAREKALSTGGDLPKIVAAWVGSAEANAAAVEGLKHFNREEARLFHYGGDLAEIRDDARGNPKIETLTHPDRLSVLIHDLDIFQKEIGDRDSPKLVSDYPPDRTVRYVWNLPKNVIGLPLYGLRTAPFFGRDGNLVYQNGYDPLSKMVLAMPEGAELTGCGEDWVPTPDEVDEAINDIADVFGDFPLDGGSRDELMDKLAKGEPTPSFCNLLAFLLLHFMRQMIDGATPIHFVAKPMPGTGATLMMNAASIITTGRGAASLDFPVTKEEVSKTLTTLFAEGRAAAFFDNIDGSLDSTELANALTAHTYMARLLGKNTSIEAVVEIIWSGAGNTVTMTGELLRRCVPIQLDAKSVDPTEGRSFEQKSLLAYVKERRWDLVSACLTLIQNWIAKGQKDGTGPELGSYEKWSQKMSGVLEAADLPGFMNNVGDWKEDAKNDDDDSLRRFLSMLAAYPVGTVFRSGDTDKPKNKATGEVETGKVVSLLDLLNDAGDPETPGEAIKLNGWAYKDVFDSAAAKFRVVYSSSSLIGRRFKTVARASRKAQTEEGEVELHFEKHEAQRNGAAYWVRVEKAK